METAEPIRRPFTYRDVLDMADALQLKSFDWPLNARSKDTYIDSHSKRYAYLLNTVGELLDQRAEAGPATALDIGPGFQTLMLQTSFPALTVDTLGFADTARMGFLQGKTRKHFEFDLNDFQTADHDLGLDRYDIITFCEVIEHLYTMPEKILTYLRPHVRPNGFIVIQTPNAVQWRHRVRMIMGRNPYDRITAYRMGHYREYTPAELREIANACGFEVRSLTLRNYFGLHKRRETALIDNLLWPIATLRSGMTAILAPRR